MNRKDAIKFRLRPRLARGAFSLILSIALGLGMEVVFRRVDGYQLTSLELVRSDDSADIKHAPSGNGKAMDDLGAREYARHLPTASDVNPSWFDSALPATSLGPPDADLVARALRYRGVELQANYEWNRLAVLNAVCSDPHRDQAIFNQFEDLYVFDPIDGSALPTFRFLRSAKYPSGLRTNNFGWRGTDLPLNKPTGTIRVGFVGASTTIGPHAEPYSYPQLVGFWLNQWGALRSPPIRFEIMNTAREGTSSHSFQAIVRQELAPLKPDFVVYYEGANQFWPATFVAGPLPPRPKESGVRPAAIFTKSALAVRIGNVLRKSTVAGTEPPKPSLVVNWPSDLDEQDPRLDDTRLPSDLPIILSDLETIRLTLEGAGGKLVMSSFNWLVYPGMVVEPVRDESLFTYLNKAFWPFSYAHMRRYLDFQNRVFRKYSMAHHVDFIDVSSNYPRDPRLFDDAIHMTRAGIRLQAWIVFNGLVPFIQRDIAAGILPRGDSAPRTVHPAFTQGRQLVPMSDVRSACNPGKS